MAERTQITLPSNNLPSRPPRHGPGGQDFDGVGLFVSVFCRLEDAGSGGQDFDGVRLFVYVFGRLGDAGSGVPG